MPSVRVDGMSLLKEELREGERLLWHGKPDSVAFGMQGYLFWIFAAGWVAFLLIFAGASDNGFFAEFDMEVTVYFLMVGVGALLCLLPVLLMLAGTRTHYAVTNLRAILLVESKRLIVTSYIVGCIDRYELFPAFRGTATIGFRNARHQDDEDINPCQTSLAFAAVADVAGCVAALELLRERDRATTPTFPSQVVSASPTGKGVEAWRDDLRLQDLLMPDEFIRWVGRPSGQLEDAIITARRRSYVITNRRVGVIATCGGKSRVEWLIPEASSILERRDRRDGFGHIVMAVLDENGVQRRCAPFWGIADAKTAYRIALDLFGI